MIRARFLNDYETLFFKRWVSLFTEFNVQHIIVGSRVAICEIDGGDVIAFAPVDFMPAQGTALVSSLWVKPGTSRENAELAGNSLDETIARACAARGIRSFLVVLPTTQPAPYERPVALLPHQIHQHTQLPTANHLN